MPEIIPSIIAKNFEEVRKKATLVEGLTNWIEVDIMDGLFVPPVTWSVAEDLENIDGKTKIEAHLMVKDPEEVVAEWAKYADRIIVHYEASTNIGDIIESFRGAFVEFGVALKIDTPMNVLLDYKDRLDFVQLMSIDKIGFSGEFLDEKIFERIKFLKENLPNVKINVDGGVNLTNAKKLISAGADNLIAGSFLWNSNNIPETLEELKQAII